MPLKTIQVEKDALIVVWTTSINGSYLIWIKCKFRFVNFDKLWHTAVAHRIKSWDVVFITKLVFVIALYLILSSLISWVWEIPASCNKEITSQFFSCLIRVVECKQKQNHVKNHTKIYQNCDWFDNKCSVCCKPTFKASLCLNCISSCMQVCLIVSANHTFSIDLSTIQPMLYRVCCDSYRLM